MVSERHGIGHSPQADGSNSLTRYTRKSYASTHGPIILAMLDLVHNAWVEADHADDNRYATRNSVFAEQRRKLNLSSAICQLEQLSLELQTSNDTKCATMFDQHSCERHSFDTSPDQKVLCCNQVGPRQQSEVQCTRKVLMDRDIHGVQPALGF